MGYEVHGIIRRSSSFNTGRINHLLHDPELEGRFKCFHGDITDGSFVTSLVLKNNYDEIYHLAAQSHVRVSFDNPVFTSDVTGIGTAIILEAMRLSGNKNCRFYFAGSSEMFGNEAPPQNEETPLRPRSPYACAKVYGYHMAKNYREGYGMHCSTGILFNHGSPRRGNTFVTRKIALGAARIKDGKQDILKLGNLDAFRDWGYAPDYVRAMWMMLQQESPDDYVIATGECHTVKEYVKDTFDYFNLSWHEYVKFDERLLRPTEVYALKGDSSKAREKIGWEPKVKYKDLINIMAKAAWKEIHMK